MLNSSLTENHFNFSDDSSGSPLSGVSMASYIELDNQQNIIKYNRRRYYQYFVMIATLM